MMLYFLDPDNNVDGWITVVNGQAVGGGVGVPASELVVIEPNTLVRLYPKDGDRWLEALRYEFRSPYVRLVYEKFMDEQGIPKPMTEAQLAQQGTQKAADDPPESAWTRTMKALNRIIDRQ